MARYKPKIIQLNNCSYIGFVDENEKEQPTVYHKFISKHFPLREKEKPWPGDKLCKITPTLYFSLSCELREASHRITYNLNKIRYELNNKQ